MAATFSYAQAAKGLVATPASSTEPIKTDEQTTESSPESTTPAVTSETDTPQEPEKTVSNADKASESTAADVSGTSTPSNGTAATSTTPKDESSNLPNGTLESENKKSQKSEKSINGEASKEKSDSDEKEKNVPPPKELKAAPLPAVNIWQQRKEAQDAKVKAITSVKPAATKNAKNASTPASTGDNQQDVSKAGSKKKGADTASESAKDKKKTEGGKRDDGSIPPVGDASSWPTPQVAQGEEKRKAQEKTEKTDKAEKSPAARSHGKEKWMPVPYVPTAVFSTPLPSSGRRGGRAARGGRDGARNGTHGAGAAAADKAPAGQVSQNAAPKQAAPTDRGRGESTTARANSLPANGRRSNSAEKAPQTTNRGAKGEDANGVPAGKQINGDSFPKHHGKSFPRNQDNGHKGVSVDTHVRPRFENGPKSAGFAGFDGDNKDHPRESRAERGRGSHRGRGGFANSQFPNSHMSHSYVHPKFGFNERQRSQQHGMANGSQQGPRMSLPSPSLPNSGAMYGVYPFPAEINTMYGYQPVQAGPMTAVPYQNYMEPFSLMSMISMQLEYYFSVDNLCKDLFLRKHMDSQGFVNLSFIASFKRIRSLTEDFELLRHVGRQLRNVEYFAGEDGTDRLRPKEKWEQWVFPMDQRDPSAQHDGPSLAKPNESHHDGLTNGTSLPNGVSKTPLSSTAPEFSPSKPLPQNEIANVGTPFEPHPFPDSQIENLVVVRRLGSPGPPHSPVLSCPSHSLLSNGSVDALKTAGRLDAPKVPSLPNPRTPVPISYRHEMSHFLLVGRAAANPSQPIFWVQEKNFPIEFLSSDFVHEFYSVFRKRALEKRNLTATQGDRDMDVLYQFWSHFLVQNFNAHMYNDFRSLALDDLSARNASNGFDRLIRFYGASLSSNKVLPDEVVRDLVDFDREKSTTQCDTVFQTLRAAWRSRSFNPRNREKIDSVLDAGLRAELEK